MLDYLCRVLGGDGPIAVFTGDAVACECCRREVVLWVRLTLGTKMYLVSKESGNCTWLTHRDGQNFPLVMWTVDGGVFDLPGAGLAAEVVARCSIGYRLCRRGDRSSLGMPRSCNEGLELRLKLTNPEGSRIRVRRSSDCLQYLWS
ncbi:hypothetical protein CDL15_Pgr026990 [Punica granatum]|uniref:Uncharacterized protein n=1 Tax=Punica granatum TaxID=22663 RepID=A0A218W733_PUNGR|nr:hypothetical protein CDL15_Pgr026990 [Punica granatum]PKI63091.1 hypothetical protein CRG98_016542 [Punica granatum]